MLPYRAKTGVLLAYSISPIPTKHSIIPCLGWYGQPNASGKYSMFRPCSVYIYTSHENLTTSILPTTDHSDRVRSFTPSPGSVITTAGYGRQHVPSRMSVWLNLIRPSGSAANRFVWSSVLEGGGEVRVHIHAVAQCILGVTDAQGGVALVNRLGPRESSLEQLWPGLTRERH